MLELVWQLTIAAGTVKNKIHNIRNSKSKRETTHI